MPEGKPERAACSIEDCTRLVHARGWCSLHYDRVRKYGDLLRSRRAAAERAFWDRVDKTGDCWVVTTGFRNARGPGRSYGRFAHGNGGAHGFALEKALGRPLAPDMHACHTCDNASCVRNDEVGWYEVNGILRPRRGHLWEGTTQDNSDDKIAKGRQARGESNHGFAHPERQSGVFRYNAKFTDEQIQLIRARAAAGEQSTSLAREYGVTRTAIGKIIRRESWKHVP